VIKLSRLDRQEIALNCDLIVSIEAHPDTTLRLTTGESLLVLESVDEVVERIAAYRSSVLRRAGFAAVLISGVVPATREAS
jgi:flagellar protein FlbD